jgi:dihydroorotate dehydrogenase
MKFDLAKQPPIMNAAGTLGFAPDARRGEALTGLGAFVTNPVSLARRTPANERGMIAFPGGILLHSGYPNPGLRAVIRRCATRWQRSPIPIIVHLLAQHADEISSMVQQLENIGGVSALEIGIAPNAAPQLAAVLVQAARGELPVIARLPLERGQELAQAIRAAGAAALSLEAPRGALPDRNGRILHGRLYGAGLLPLALECVQRLADQGYKVIGGCGVYRQSDADAMLQAGAVAVQIDTALWRV